MKITAVRVIVLLLLLSVLGVSYNRYAENQRVQKTIILLAEWTQDPISGDSPPAFKAAAEKIRERVNKLKATCPKHGAVSVLAKELITEADRVVSELEEKHLSFSEWSDKLKKKLPIETVNTQSLTKQVHVLFDLIKQKA